MLCFLFLLILFCYFIIIPLSRSLTLSVTVPLSFTLSVYLSIFIFVSLSFSLYLTAAPLTVLLCLTVSHSLLQSFSLKLFPSLSLSLLLGLTFYRDDSHMSAPAVHLRAKEPAVLADGVALDAAERISGTSTSPHAEQHTYTRSRVNNNPLDCKLKCYRCLKFFPLTCVLVLTRCVFAWRGADRVLEVRHGLVAEVQVVVPGLVQQVSTAQVRLDHLFFSHCACEEVHGEQRKTHLQ